LRQTLATTPQPRTTSIKVPRNSPSRLSYIFPP
jgi:hypothetical protein